VRVVRLILEARLAAGRHWQDRGFVLTSALGTPLEPRNVTRQFKALLTAAKLPDMRLHDLRHSCATLLLAQGVNPRVVMETLGHSQGAVRASNEVSDDRL
jgi:integrase